MTDKEKILYHEKEMLKYKKQILIHQREIKAINLKYKSYYTYKVSELDLEIIEKWKDKFQVTSLLERNKNAVMCKVEIIRELREDYSRTFDRIGFTLWFNHTSIVYLYKKYVKK